VELLKKLYREHGMRLTPQRLEIFRLIDSAKDHPSIYEHSKPRMSRHPTISHDTIYRGLDAFIGWKLDKVEFLGVTLRFDPNNNPHHHHSCTECRGIRDIYWNDFAGIDLPPDAVKWGQPQTRHGQVEGACDDCVEKREI
jgi:Fur family peroxide stress response transcriptional regulator